MIAVALAILRPILKCNGLNLDDLLTDLPPPRRTTWPTPVSTRAARRT